MHAVIGLGANLGSREANLRAAVDAIARLPQCRVVAASPIYQTDPIGPPQPLYLNAAVSIETGLDANILLNRLKAIEVAFGRETTERWGARIIDLDILWSDSPKIETSGLTVPHPGLQDRAFALAPLLDVAPQLDRRYAHQLNALGGRPEQVGRLDRQPTWRVLISDEQCEIEVRSFDRYDALALALSGLAQNSIERDQDRALEIEVVLKECKPGEECRVFVRETVERVRSGFRYCWALVSTLHSGRVSGRLAGHSNGGQPIEIADIEVEESRDSDNSAIILLTRPVAKFNKPNFL